MMELYSIIHSEFSNKTYIVFLVLKFVFLSSNSDDSDKMPHSVRSTLFAKVQFYEIPAKIELGQNFQKFLAANGVQ